MQYAAMFSHGVDSGGCVAVQLKCYINDFLDLSSAVVSVGHYNLL